MWINHLTASQGIASDVVNGNTSILMISVKVGKTVFHRQ